MKACVPKVPVAVSLRRLFPSASFVGCADIHVARATQSSRECGPNTLFAAISGTQTDGTQFVGDAISRGATSLLVRRPLSDVPLPQCVVPDVRRAFAELCDSLAGYPSCRLKIAGATGTNGKTTVSWLIRSIMQAAGRQTGLLGTVEYSDGVDNQSADLTTPDPQTLFQWLRSMVQNRTTHAAIELSSHALQQGRVSGLKLHAAVVTNVTQDHFDYHQDFQSYLAAKSNILTYCREDGVLVLNADDPGAVSLRERHGGGARIVTYGLDQGSADCSATILEETLSGSRFILSVGDVRLPVSTTLIGRHNVSNCLAAAAVASHFGVAADAISQGIGKLVTVPGRLERIDCGQPFDVLVDYAHTDDALRCCIQQLVRLARGRVICVFGAGGDRDCSKRFRLGQAASQAELVVVTSDNPRTENPQKIIHDIVAGVATKNCDLHVEVDRRTAIRWAIEKAKPGDCVLVAGKGHEVDQIVGTQRFPFDDRTVIRGILQQKPQFAYMNRERLRA